MVRITRTTVLINEFKPALTACATVPYGAWQVNSFSLVIWGWRQGDMQLCVMVVAPLGLASIVSAPKLIASYSVQTVLGVPQPTHRRAQLCPARQTLLFGRCRTWRQQLTSSIGMSVRCSTSGSGGFRACVQ